MEQKTIQRGSRIPERQRRNVERGDLAREVVLNHLKSGLSHGELKLVGEMFVADRGSRIADLGSSEAPGSGLRDPRRTLIREALLHLHDEKLRHLLEEMEGTSSMTWEEEEAMVTRLSANLSSETVPWFDTVTRLAGAVRRGDAKALSLVHEINEGLRRQPIIFCDLKFWRACVQYARRIHAHDHHSV